MSVERLDREAERLASEPTAKEAGRGRDLTSRIRDNRRVLLRCYRTLARAIRDQGTVPAAAEWFVDNFHVVDSALQLVRSDLPRGFYRQLPKLASGAFAGYPRVLALMHAFAAHTDSRFDASTFRQFLGAFQRVQPLTIGELWTVSIVLRLVLLENLRRLAEGIAVPLLQGRPGRDPELAAADVTVRNVITSLRALSTFEGAAFFERVSPVDEALRAGSDFDTMDFPSRDRYRHAIEDLSRGSGLSEVEVARRALERSAGAAREATRLGILADRVRDPGYYLISQGRPVFEKEIGYRVPFGRRLIRAYVSTATASYLGTIGIVTAFLLALPLLSATDSGMGLAWLVLLGLVAAIPASDLAIALVNRAVIELLGPRRLPRLALRDGVPPGLRTMVVVPTLLTREAEIAEQISALEVHYLANPAGDLHFALLSDWTDAATETMPGDDQLLAAAREGIRRLNARHPLTGGGERFLLLHRRRLWNAAEGVWMGWERKRGKLHELNRLLRGATDTTFLGSGGRPPAVPSGVKYVITLDADTRLPRDAASQLVGTLAHPLNRPTFDPHVGREVYGFAILQPRVTPTLPPEREASLFQRTFSGPAGLDPYAAAVSDVYQDLFGEGSYTGKGIYEVDVFEAALDGRTPENALLSHDLFEGLFARTGLVSDVELFEQFPSSYEVSASRQHRWARGDWQLLPWILSKRAPGAIPTRLPTVARWKMVDNLRRTLSAPAAFITLVAGWTIPGSSPAVWTQLVLVAMALPVLIPAATEAGWPRPGVGKRAYLRGLGRNLAGGAAQLALNLVFLAHQAWLMADAIGRTLFRLTVTRQKMLEWVTAARAKAGLDQRLRSVYSRMSGAVALGIGAGVLVALAAPHHWLFAAPFVLVWLLSPAVARWVSRPLATGRVTPLSPPELRALRSTARRTWRFFETVVGQEDNALPPDNLQEDPAPVVAHRTSPTNMGLYLLSALAARDLGWVGTIDTVERLARTLASMRGLERFRGHFFNWYDTRERRPLEPRYVSTVDSGNLAGHLIVLEQACREMIDAPVFVGEAFHGIEDALLLARDAASNAADRRARPTVAEARLAEAISSMTAALAESPVDPVAAAERLRELGRMADSLTDAARSVAGDRGAREDAAVLVWAEATGATIESHRRDIDMLMPWLAIPDGLLADLARDFPAETRAIRELTLPPGLPQLPGSCAAAVAQLEVIRSRVEPTHSSLAKEIDGLIDRLRAASAAARALAGRLSDLARLSRQLFDAMHFDFLVDQHRQVFSIGYRVAEGSLDPAGYDLLASEARLASFIAIAKGDIPGAQWFRLARPMIPVGFGAALVSWSGSMFEYLMPALVMDSPPGSLLDQTARLVVRRQMSYAASRGVPWGISESAYNVRDLDFTYQYSNFGVPGLGLDRRLGENLVIAPYATGLAAMVDPGAVALNFAALARAGARGPLGFYDALDYTGTRLAEGQTVAVVRAYMAHHQAMTLLALANVLDGDAMRARFHREPIVQATELLLQERPPESAVVTRPRVDEVTSPAHVRDVAPPAVRRFPSPHSATPETHLLGSRRYAVMVTAAGSGYSQWGDLAVTRWREDATRDHWGAYVFLRDAVSGAVWSAAYQPTGVEAHSYEAAFFEDRAEFRRRDGDITSALDIVVSPEDDAEVRRVSLTNSGPEPREIEVTSYCELALAPAAADAAYPAFSKLFVHTEAVPELDAVLATRRARAPGDPVVWAAHVAAVEGDVSAGAEWETDRACFIGRGRDIRAPLALTDGRPLSGATGPVLDPIASLRRRVRLAPGSSARVTFATLVAPSRERALGLAEKYRDPAAFHRVSALAWAQAQAELHHLGIEPDEAHLYQRLAGRICYSDSGLRAPSEVLGRNGATRARLWAHRISGDLPIALVEIDDPESTGIVRQLLRAHEYWHLKGLAVDLVILNAQATSYTQDLQGALQALVQERPLRGNIFVLRADLLSPGERDCLQTAARAVLRSRDGTLADQVLRAARPDSPAPPAARRVASPEPALDPRLPRLELDNGRGGFAGDGREYVTVLGAGQSTPRPWVNVIANRELGFQVSESGAGYTWCGNSRENQLTPWSNDPVTDPSGEIIYVRDAESGALWGPTALPIRDDTALYVARHGQGYSRFEHVAHGIALDLVQFVPWRDPVKISHLTIENRSHRARRLSVTAYVEWALGASRSAAAPFIATERDEDTGAILARNPWSIDFGARVAFADLGGRQESWTGDRTEVIGRNGSPHRPLALDGGIGLSGRVGAGLDPCAALQATLELAAGESAEVVVLLGQAATRDEARALIRRYRAADPGAVLDEVKARWDEILGAVEIRTPDRAMDVLMNRWLLYQTLGCRIWGRSAFYQLSGAYGFRDQLQDAMALVLAAPEVAREHLLRAAGRQFVEGDVQHWWHPPAGRGVRTRVSDDAIWLPHTVAHYVEATGDASVLEEVIPFLEGPPLAPEQSDSYFEPAVSPERGTLFEHCARALDRSLTVGEHGLPLIGGGDWNDGMNRVGLEGRGESVWLAWFLHASLAPLARWADERGLGERAGRWRAHGDALRDALERHAWDGDWYRRGYFDDGTPIGSARDAECRIDSIAQSWAVLSGAAEPTRAARAMAAMEEHLVRPEAGLILLFTPPFDRTPRDPGYIKGYPPGVRENGGHYTHAAVWAVMAMAALGNGDRASELFALLNPINRSRTPTEIDRYQVEPYVLAADVYAEPPHVGRGGWTWYTGSAGWMYRAGLESILGVRVRGATLRLDPCIPRQWPRYEVTVRYRRARYVIHVENPNRATRGIATVQVDGVPVAPGTAIALLDDAETHRVRVLLGDLPGQSRPHPAGERAG